VLNKRIVITKTDFFKGLVFLDYLTNIILGEYKILDEMYDVAKKLEEKDKNLDPDMEVIVRYAAVNYVSKTSKNNPSEDREGIRRYNQKNKGYEDEYFILRKVSPAYEALGKMVVSMIKNNDIKDCMQKMTKLYDIKSAVFIDVSLEYITSEAVKNQIITQMKEGDYYNASIRAINRLSKEITNKSLNKYIDSIAGDKD
jgi:hypothetical protein